MEIKDLLLAALLSGCFYVNLALDNGLALTPPMGWMTWERFRCITDCQKYPNECISEALINRTADLMVNDGYLKAGYNHLIIDDCWLERERDSQGKLVADKKRFPNGMKAVANTPNYESIAKHCNLWRNWDDIDDSWESVRSIMEWFANNQDVFAKYAGPGRWNDPDMLIIGNFGLSLDQAKVQMAVWSVLAAPLIMSVDLATIRPEFREVLLNEEVIAVDQDVLGKQGLRVWSLNNCEIWTRELSRGSYAVAFVNKRTDGTPTPLSVTFDNMKIPKQSYKVHDLYKEEENQFLSANENFETRVNPTGVKFYKFIPKKSNNIV